MRVLIFGGTFNPVHIGHLHMVDEARTEFQFDRIIFVPTNLPAHKSGESVIDPAHRLQMLHLATHWFPEYTVDPCEIERGGVSYTIDTVRDIVKRMNLIEKPYLLIGDDLVAGFKNWKMAEVLAQEVSLVVALREAGSKPGFEYPHQVLENLLLPISSSDVRFRIRKGHAYRHLLSVEVAEYITKNALYSHG